MPSPSGPTDRPLPAVDGISHRFETIGSTRYHVACAGPDDGPAYVLLHGWPQSWWIWHEIMPALAAAGHRVVAPDLRGCGWSDADRGSYEKEQLAADVVALLDQLGVDRFALAGHDWGGWVAQILALRIPDRIERITLAGIASLWASRGTTARHAWRFGYQALVATPRVGPALQRSSVFWSAMQRAGIPAADVGVYRGAYDDPARAEAGSRIYRDFLRREVPALSRGRYESDGIALPVTVLLGRRDPVIRPAMVMAFGRGAPRPRVEVLDCGHFVCDELPAVVTERLLEPR